MNNFNYGKLNVEESERLTTCPYNKSHQIPKKHFQKHLIKCRKSNPEIKLGKIRLTSSTIVYKESKLIIHFFSAMPI